MKILSGILLIGFLVCIYHIITDQGGSAFGNIIDTLTITSIILFVYCILLLIISFKKNIKQISIWLILLISSPLAIMAISNQAKNLKLKLTVTTTPKQYQYDLKINQEKYTKDKIKLQNQIDSLIKIKIIKKPSNLGLRYFNGKTYNDTIERDWSINLPMKIEYRKIIIDTLFYSNNDGEIIAGLLISKTINQFRNPPEDSINFMGNAFTYYSNSIKPFEILKYRVSGYDNYEDCSDRLKFWYYKKIGTYKNEYNLNDKRFLNKI